MAFPVDFTLPPERIAHAPCVPRDAARLMVVGATLEHRHVFDLPELLKPGDLLIFNDTRVVPARLLGKRRATGGKWEGLFLRVLPDGCWEMIGQTRGRLNEGEWIDIDPAPLALEFIERLPEGRWRVRPAGAGDWVACLERHGRVPLPPYIRHGEEGEEDRGGYQTVYAKEAGAVAAPTAGLHFTEELLERLAARGIKRAFVTLHVGLGTFRPIDVEDYRQHTMHAEWGVLPEATVRAIAATREGGGRIVAVGTTSVRVLETAAQQGPLVAWSGDTRLFVHPPFDFKVVDVLLTNFHLPRSTLLLLVAAFGAAARMQAAYEEAIREGYRFFSYGDAMLIEKVSAGRSL